MNIAQELRRLADEIEKPDPYAELRAAWEAGAIIQYTDDNNFDGKWMTTDHPMWVKHNKNNVNPRYRIKPEEPWTLPRELPGFRALRDGEEWHRQDFTKEMLDGGWRPLLKGERRSIGDALYPTSGSDSWRNKWQTMDQDWLQPQAPANEDSFLSRTKRPLPILSASQIAEGWKEWHGGQNPASGKRVLATLRSGWNAVNGSLADKLDWRNTGGNGDIIAYRVIEPKLVPLGPDDVRCGDEVRLTDTRYCIAQVESGGVFIANYGRRSFTQLQEAWKIRRRDSATFEPCSKEDAE